jgi:septum formation protein
LQPIRDQRRADEERSHTVVRPPPLTLVLASASPRRTALLARLGLDVRVVVPSIDERFVPGETPEGHAVRLAREKAAAVLPQASGQPILAADTVVVIGGAVLGKPAGVADARRMLERLSGCWHSVLTAVHVVWGEREAGHLEAVRVRFARLSRGLIDWYLASGEPADKAGAYAVQGGGAILVERIEGNVQAVVGLPLAPLPALFERVGLRLVRSGARLVLTPTHRRGGRGSRR